MTTYYTSNTLVTSQQQSRISRGKDATVALSCGIVAFVLAMPAVASAQATSTYSKKTSIGRALGDMQLTAGLHFGYGWQLTEGDAALYQGMASLYAGVTLPSQYYVGLRIDAFGGEEQDNFRRFGTTYTLDQRVTQLLLEVGYEQTFDQLAFRPIATLGTASVVTEFCADDIFSRVCEQDRESALSVGVGAHMAFAIFERAEVSSTLRLNQILGEFDLDVSGSSLFFAIGGGYRF